MAGIYSKVVSTTRQIDSIHTFIGGVKKDIDSVFVFVNGERKQVFPSSEVYTEVFANTTGGAYSTSLGYGRYKIVISGGGGSGSSLALRHTESTSGRTQHGGGAGELKTIMIDVPYGQTWTFSGTVGTGGKGSSTYAGRDGAYTITRGAVGTGYANGTQGSTVAFSVSRIAGGAGDGGMGAMAGGSGGGSTSLLINGELNTFVKGGNGGSASIYTSVSYGGYPAGTKTVSGGTGGSGGISGGTGAAGGAASYGAGSSSGNTSGAGANGYVHIYKSSIYPN